MRRFISLAAVSCLCVGALAGPGRADIIYDVFQGGSRGTRLAEYQVPNFLTDGEQIPRFTPTLLISGVGSPGGLTCLTVNNEAVIGYISHSPDSRIDAFLTSTQFPTSPGTYARQALERLRAVLELRTKLSTTYE
jgi:hypothetical protein